jgi:hypothetical protein
MPSWIESRLAIVGLLRLALFNPDFERFFDRSPGGALRSFWLAIPYLPYSALVIVYSGLAARAANLTQFGVSMSVGYVFMWLLPPAILTWIAPVIGRRAEMAGCIAIYNWMSLLHLGAGLPFLALSMAGVPDEFMSIPGYILVIVSVIWEAFLLTHVLRIVIWQAALVSVADYLVTQFVLIPVFLVAGSVT